MCGIDYNKFDFHDWEKCRFGDSKITCYLCGRRFEEDDVEYDEEEDDYICKECEQK